MHFTRRVTLRAMRSISAAQKIFLVRHGQREDFENPTWPETAERPFDTPLSTTGFRQAVDVGRALTGQGIGAIYSSPFLRALQTADAIAEALQLPIRVEPGVSEWWNPAWIQGPPALLGAKEMIRMFPRIDRSYQPVIYPEYPEYDETREVRSRVWQVLYAIVNRVPAEHVVIVAHGSPLGQLIGLMTPNAPGIQMQVASITRIDRVDSTFNVVHSGLDHLRDQVKEVRFH